MSLPRPTSRTTAAAMALALAALAGACAGTRAGGPAPAPAPAPAGRPAESVQSAIGDAACDTDAQCATVGVGAKACGGPAAYAAWSRLRTDPERLRTAVEREADEQRRAIAASGRMSDCSALRDPGAFCDRSAPRAGGPAGVCRLKEIGGLQLPQVR